jgi:propionyl-CoA carboxylase alpha chain
MTGIDQTTNIRTLLIANRGEVARRIMRTARSMGIVTVAVYSDADASSPHVAEADLAVRLPGVSAADTYLRSAMILDAASRTGADAIHPGYGFLSESGDFARVVTGAGFTWVGPAAASIEVMGSKVGAKEIMRTAGVPTLASITLSGDALPEDADLEALGWPLLIKASAGGGGRGMRVVGGPVSLRQAIVDARHEAEAAFGDGSLFLERYVTDPRHIEVQIVADAYGDTVALFERECSIQRRHQKIIEEAPSPIMTAALRARLVEAAVAAARAVEYVNVGTVEFVVDANGDPYFLEMNTRLQVEHPVTEAVAGIDLVRLQLLIASGHRLPDEVHRAATDGPRGHAIEARLIAEDPSRRWTPSTGTLHRFEIPSAAPSAVGSPSARVDSGVESGNTVSAHYDSLLAKVIVHAATRNEAASALAAVLARSRIHGVTTNRDLLVRILRHPAFLAGETDTGFIERQGLSSLAAPLADREARCRHAVAAALAGQATRRSTATVQPAAPSGFRNNPFSLQQEIYDSDGEVFTVGYRFDRFGRVPAVIDVAVDGDRIELDIDLDSPVSTPDEVTLSTGGITRRYQVDRVGSAVFVDGPDGSSALVEQDRFPTAAEQTAEGSALAPMPGGVVRVAVSQGDVVEAGQLLVVLEAMKMQHTVHASGPGTVIEVGVVEGDQVEAGRPLVVVEARADSRDPG